MKLRDEYTCPLELTHDMIKGKWKCIILWRLYHRRTSLSQLERTIEGISQKMLLQHLKELIEFGFVEKKVFEGYPLRVEYFLTKPKGVRLLEALEIMEELGIGYMKENGMQDVLDQMKAAREYYDNIFNENNLDKN